MTEVILPPTIAPRALSAFSVAKYQHGVAIFGAVPIDEAEPLLKSYQRAGYKLLAVDLCAPLHATLVLVKNAVDHHAWKAEINESAARKAAGDRELEWLFGTDTGTSSLTIFSVLSSAHGHRALTGSRQAGVPHDPDDFGRCHRLLERIPEWRSRLPEVAARHKDWAPLVERWGDLESLWREESPRGKAPRLYDLMQALLQESTR